jgi:hypothetical protein
MGSHRMSVPHQAAFQPNRQLPALQECPPRPLYRYLQARYCSAFPSLRSRATVQHAGLGFASTRLIQTCFSWSWKTPSNAYGVPPRSQPPLSITMYSRRFAAPAEYHSTNGPTQSTTGYPSTLAPSQVKHDNIERTVRALLVPSLAIMRSGKESTCRLAFNRPTSR